jgi:cytochrome o ubiquinol oxidase subunit 2
MPPNDSHAPMRGQQIRPAPACGHAARWSSLGLLALLSGCGMTLFDPKGDIGAQEKT